MKGVGEGDPNAIVSQLIELTWRIACFRMILQTRRLANARGQGEPRLNPLFHELLDSTFADAVLISMRRLVGSFDTPESLDHPVKGTYSLTAVLNDVRKHRMFVTRSALVGLDGTGIDVAEVRRAEDAYLRSHPNVWCEVPPELNSRKAEGRHTEIDALCGVSPDQRTPDDHISESWLDDLVSHLKNAVGKLNVWANKFVAHLATPESRRAANTDDIKVTFTDIWDAHKAICRVVARLDVFLVSGIHKDFMPLPHPSTFSHLAEPLVNPADLPALMAFWKTMEQDLRTYSATNGPALLESSSNE
jgi:hypothetical protein